MQLKRISLSKVLKLELPELINEVVRIVEKNDPDLLRLRTFQNLLKEQQQQMKLLVVPAIADPLTLEVQLLREKELQCVGAIVSHMQFVVRSDIESMRPATSVANPIVIRFLNGLRKNNDSVINETIHQFLKHLDEHPKVYDALSNLGLHPFVEEIRKMNAQKIEVMEQRDVHQLKRTPKVNSRLIQKNAQSDLNLMFDVIQSESSYHDNRNFDPLVGELNVLLTRYATIINTRKTHNRNRSKDMKDENAE